MALPCPTRPSSQRNQTQDDGHIRRPGSSHDRRAAFFHHKYEENSSVKDAINAAPAFV